MKDLSTKYLGLDLKNPVIISSSGLTASVEKVYALAQAGAGAVVLKSVFEEQIVHQTTFLEGYNAYPEAAGYLAAYLQDNYLSTYLGMIEGCKKAVEIPVIASINCLSDSGNWSAFAGRIEAAGADAIELNIFTMPTSHKQKGSDIEAANIRIIGQVASGVKIPVSVKISPRFTNPLQMIEGVMSQGAKGIVMFNRFYEPDIDLGSMLFNEGEIFSSSADLRESLRWVAMASAEFPHLDIASSGGIHTSDDAVKMLLCGARAVEICSTVYRNGVSVIRDIQKGIEEWMDKHTFDTVGEFVGAMNYKRISNPVAFERSQFMKYYSSRK